MTPIRALRNRDICDIDENGCYVEAWYTVWIVQPDGVDPLLGWSDTLVKGIAAGLCYYSREDAISHFNRIKE